MIYTYILLFLVCTAIAALLFSYLRRRSKSNVAKLFQLALRDENSGAFSSAIQQYETALLEAEKAGFNGQLRNRIIEKLKVLQTITSYEKDMHQEARIVQFDQPISLAGPE